MGAFLISIVPTVTFSFQRLVLALQYGYSFLYDPSLVETGLDAVFSRIRLFFPISLICLFIGASDRKFIRMLVFACTVMTVGVGFLTGGRGAKYGTDHNCTLYVSLSRETNKRDVKCYHGNSRSFLVVFYVNNI